MSSLDDIRFGWYPGLSHSLSIPTSNDAKDIEWWRPNRNKPYHRRNRTNCDSSHRLHVKLRLESMNVFAWGICLSVNVISDVDFGRYPFQTLVYHIHYRFRRRMMPKPVRRVGVKASGVQQVMATEQETKLTIVVKKRTNCNSSHYPHAKPKIFLPW